MRNGMGKWECAISSSSSTSDIIFVKPSGDYSPRFIEDSTVNRFKAPSRQKKTSRKVKK